MPRGARALASWGTPRASRRRWKCAIAGVPWCLTRLSLFSTSLNMLLTNKPPQAKSAETDPRHGTHLRWHTSNRHSRQAVGSACLCKKLRRAFPLNCLSTSHNRTKRSPHGPRPYDICVFQLTLVCTTPSALRHLFHILCV